MLSTEVKEAQYELAVSKKFVILNGNTFERDDRRWEANGEFPENFRRMVGNYKQVADEAIRRNEFQIKSGFIDYLYHPEPYIMATKSEEAK